MPEPQKLITRCLSTAPASISIRASMASQRGLLATPETHSLEKAPWATATRLGAVETFFQLADAPPPS